MTVDTRGGGRSLRILIVDPEEQIRAILQSALVDAGFATFGADTAAAARAHSRRIGFALAIVELMLADGGPALLRELQDQGVRTVAMCGHPEGIGRTHELGCPFLQKPFTIKGILGLVATMLPLDHGA
jgi:DNA-binding response OmpR family regulator